MPGPIIPAKEAARVYPDDVKRVGGKIVMKNSVGRKVEVSPQEKVYNRGAGNFGRYSQERDRRRTAGGKELPCEYAVGNTGKGGRYRHTDDKADTSKPLPTCPKGSGSPRRKTTGKHVTQHPVKKHNITKKASHKRRK